jgi:hypothetical protein
LHRTELEREIASLLKEYASKDLKQHMADLRPVSTSGHAPVRPTHIQGQYLEALTDPPSPKRARSEEPRLFKLHDVKPPFYEGKNQHELDEFLESMKRIFLLDVAIHHTESIRSLYASQYLKGNSSQRWKNHIRKRDRKTLSLTELKNVLQDIQAPPHLSKVELVRHWHHARQGLDQLVSDCLTYCEILEDEIGNISEELRVLSELVGYHAVICDGFPNDHIPLSREGISRIALNVESKDRFKGKDRVHEGGAKP